MLKSEYFSGSTITFRDEVVEFDENGKATASKEAEAHLSKADTIEFVAEKKAEQTKVPTTKEPAKKEPAKKAPAKKAPAKKAPAKKVTEPKGE